MSFVKYIYLGGLLLFFTKIQGQIPPRAETKKSESLEGKFRQLNDESETYQEYKVVRRDRLGSFWSEVTDTLARNAQNKAKVQANLQTAEKNISDLENQLEETEQALEQVTFEKDRISFLGWQLIKSTYSFLVWGVIVLLAILVVIYQLRYTRAGRITERTKKQGRELESEFEGFKNNAREKETKLRRELQTEINKVEELEQRVTFHKG